MVNESRNLQKQLQEEVRLGEEADQKICELLETLKDVSWFKLD